jgi:hypothetical protein
MKNWKTTFTGLVMAILIGIQPLAEGDVDLKRDWLRFTIAIFIAVFGYFAKDFDRIDK